MRWLLLLACVSGYAQFTSTARHIGQYASAPAHCSTATGDIYYNTTSKTPFYCSATDTWSSMAGGGGGAFPAGSLGCVQLYATATTFGSGCASHGIISSVTVQSAANSALMGALTPGFDGDIPIAGSADAGFTETIDMAGGTTVGAYLALVAFNNSATPKTLQVGSFELDGHLNANGTNALEDFQILDQSTGNPTSGKVPFGINLITPGGGNPPCTTPCANLDSGGTFFVGSLVSTAFKLSSDLATQFSQAKVTVSAVAPGAGSCIEVWRAGTNAGTGKLVAYCGTSATGVTIVDNVGSGF